MNNPHSGDLSYDNIVYLNYLYENMKEALLSYETDQYGAYQNNINSSKNLLRNEYDGSRNFNSLKGLKIFHIYKDNDNNNYTSYAKSNAKYFEINNFQRDLKLVNNQQNIIETEANNSYNEYDRSDENKENDSNNKIDNIDEEELEDEYDNKVSLHSNDYEKDIEMIQDGLQFRANQFI